jgi:hypothetical protein
MTTAARSARVPLRRGRGSERTTLRRASWCGGVEVRGRGRRPMRSMCVELICARPGRAEISERPRRPPVISDCAQRPVGARPRDPRVPTLAAGRRRQRSSRANSSSLPRRFSITTRGSIGSSGGKATRSGAGRAPAAREAHAWCIAPVILRRQARVRARCRRCRSRRRVLPSSRTASRTSSGLCGRAAHARAATRSAAPDPSSATRCSGSR